MNEYESSLRALKAELSALKVKWALVGGFAVTALGSGRSTTDIDLAAAVVDDKEAERIVYEMTRRGYRVETQLEQEATGRLSTARLITPHAQGMRVLVDFIFSTTGVEREIVAGAQPMNVFRGLSLPVARPAHLIAMKVLSFAAHRPTDLSDLIVLLRNCSEDDLREVRRLLGLIVERGYSRGRDLEARLSEVLEIAAHAD